MNFQEQIVASRIKTRIQQKNPLAEVILFGSHARGQSHKDSDWDVLILLNQPIVNYSIVKDYRDDLYDLELEIGEPIAPFIFSKTEWEQKHAVTPLYKNIKRDGISL